MQVANAYGEFEPGAKARKKAAKENKVAAANNNGGASQQLQQQQQNARLDTQEALKAALGSYSTSTMKRK